MVIFLHECRVRQDNVISRRNIVAGFLEREPHVTLLAKDMNDPSCVLLGVVIQQRVSKNDAVEFCLFHSCWYFMRI